MANVELYKVRIEDEDGTKAFYPHTSTDVVFDKTGKSVDELLDKKSDTTHTHDDRYYTETEMNTKLSVKLDTTGNASNVTNTFTQATSRANLTTGEKLAVSLGKIMKWFADLKAVAFSGSYADLTNKPTALKNPTAMKVQLNSGTTEGTNQFTYDGSTAKNVNITPSGIGAAASNHNHDSTYSKIKDGSGALLKDAPMTPNDNLLTNSDFRSGIINQKRITSLDKSDGSTELGIDRWILYGINIAVGTNYVTFANRTNTTHTVQQPLDIKGLKVGDKVTFYASCFNITGNVYIYMTGLDAQKKKLSNGDNEFTLTLTSALERFYIELEPNAVVSFNCKKLEIGEHFTGMPAWDESIELTKCRKHYRRDLNKYLPAWQGLGTNKVSYCINYEGMNKTPSVKILGGFSWGADGYSAQFQSAGSAFNVKQESCTIEVTFNKAVSDKILTACLNVEIDSNNY